MRSPPDPITEITTEEGTLILTGKAVLQIEASPGRPVRRQIRLEDLESWHLDRRRQPAWLAIALVGLVVGIAGPVAGPTLLGVAGLFLAATGGLQYHWTAREVLHLAGPGTRIRATGRGARRWALRRFDRRLSAQIGARA